MTVLDRANTEQRAASNPATSAFVAASAGSGKTKLLTDRLLRLMLAGTPPGRILCLTYTKAAAAEMTIRLNRRLGEWVVLPQTELEAALAELDVRPNSEICGRARQLFADVQDLPGGMRISTIHAFCQSLLRRFPLEAGLSPHFELEDETAAAQRLRDARETVLADPNMRRRILALAAETNEQDFAALTAKFCAGDDLQSLLRDFTTVEITDMQAAALGAETLDDAAILTAAVTCPRQQQLAESWRRIAAAGTPSGQALALKNLDWLAHPPDAKTFHWDDWVDGHLTGAGKPRVLSKFFGKNLAAERDALDREIAAEQARIITALDARKAARLASLNRHLINLLAPILQTNNTGKTAALSYADLIAHTGRILIDPGAAWILYKLDGGIDHLLLDEVQDTAPTQWDIAGAIAAEFFAGAGARDVPRSVFAVGDAKQSIFSFQGADLQSFETYRAKFRNQVQDAGQNWLDGQLSVSFRSTAPVLALTDAVFAQGPARTGVCEDTTLTHGVSRIGQAGSVTLWPLTQAVAAPALPSWAPPSDYQGADSAKAILARDLAAHIKTLLDSARILPSRARPITPGDILVLVRHRDELVTALTAACKAAGVPIAGIDRMALTEQQAVSDLLALCDILLLPEDDLAFGQFLASPLGGLSDESLMHLAIGRPSSLSAALHARRAEQPDWAAAAQMFDTLRRRADFITPYALLSEALGPLGGRGRLLQRLGAEAAEPIDELLAEAITHARAEPGSLQTFVHALRQSGASIKREADGGGDVVRIMTVHGAKGLQAPVVILPDTTGIPNHNDKLYWLPVPQQNTTVPIFCPRAALRSAAVTAAQTTAKAAITAEQNRLLYVALTRAEDELLICGAKGSKAPPDTCWYHLVEAGFAHLGIAPDENGHLTLETPQTSAPDRIGAKTTPTIAPLPAWAGAAPAWSATPPAAETTRPEPLAPSRATEAEEKQAIAASPLGGGLATGRAARLAALAKGRVVHALLQHLPDLPPPKRRAAAAKYLAKTPELDAPNRAAILESVISLLEDPALAPLFGPGSRAEIPLAGVVADIEIGGLADRLAILPDRILLADYKTDRAPPTDAAGIPPAYLRQLAAYQAILRQIFPTRPITCLLIFTQTAAVLTVPPDLLAGHAPAPAQPYEA
jgi:ATP-dependent helicase/nuclease subunit A